MSLDGKYKIVIQSPMGPMEGEINLLTSGTTATGNVTDGENLSEFNDGTVDGNVVIFEAELPTPMGNFVFHFEVAIDGDKMTGSAKMAFGDFPLEGNRI